MRQLKYLFALLCMTAMFGLVGCEKDDTDFSEYFNNQVSVVDDIDDDDDDDKDDDSNTGDEDNTGDQTDDDNTGDNTSDNNTSDDNTGDDNTGEENTGDNTGDDNTGDNDSGNTTTNLGTASVIVTYNGTSAEVSASADIANLSPHGRLRVYSILPQSSLQTPADPTPR